MTVDTPQDPEESRISLEDTLAAVLDAATPLAARFLYRLSDLTGEELAKLAEIWPKIDPQRRENMLVDLELLAESNYVVSFESVNRLALKDPAAEIRKIAIRALWETESKDLARIFLEILENDPDIGVRAQAAYGLGQFIYLGELSKIARGDLERIVDRLIKTIEQKEPLQIQQRALESLGFSSDSRVPHLIEDAYDTEDPEWTVSALMAMGRTADEQWESIVMDKLDHADNDIALEAVRAAGELAIAEASPALLNYLQDENVELRLAAAWSLSEIGGHDARDGIQFLIDETEDDEELDLLEAAMDNLAFNEELGDFSLLDLDEDLINPSPEED